MPHRKQSILHVHGNKLGSRISMIVDGNKQRKNKMAKDLPFCICCLYTLPVPSIPQVQQHMQANHTWAGTILVCRVYVCQISTPVTPHRPDSTKKVAALERKKHDHAIHIEENPPRHFTFPQTRFDTLPATQETLTHSWHSQHKGWNQTPQDIQSGRKETNVRQLWTHTGRVRKWDSHPALYTKHDTRTHRAVFLFMNLLQHAGACINENWQTLKLTSHRGQTIYR